MEESDNLQGFEHGGVTGTSKPLSVLQQDFITCRERLVFRSAKPNPLCTFADYERPFQASFELGRKAPLPLVFYAFEMLDVPAERAQNRSECLAAGVVLMAKDFIV